MLDNFYITILKAYSTKSPKTARRLALVYINYFELAALFAIATFFKAFASQLKLGTLSTTKFVSLFVVAIGIVLFKNWMQYNGKKRLKIKTKIQPKAQSVVILWLMPTALLLFGLILFQG